MLTFTKASVAGITIIKLIIILNITAIKIVITIETK
jgi:hypothetical protein